MTNGQRAVIAAVAVNLMGVLPLFLTGGMSVQIARQFGVAPASVGAMASLFALASAAGSAPLGRQVGRLGIRRSMWAATAASTVSLLLATLSVSMVMLAVALLVGGLGNAMGQPSGNALVAAQVRPSRYGLGFAIKQSGIPLATTIGGFSVPLIALTIGWRYAYLFAAVAAVVAVLLVPADRKETAQRSEHEVPKNLVRPLWLLAFGMVAAAAAATSIGALGAAGGVAAGLGEAAAGYLVAVGGLTGLALRLGTGVAADRRSFDPLIWVSVMCVIGAGGWLLMAPGNRLFFILGLVIANAFGWGWPGLQHLAVARRFPTATAAASGVSQTGVAIGLLTGPALLSLIAHRSWPATWVTVAALALVAAAVTRVAAARIPQPCPEQH